MCRKHKSNLIWDCAPAGQGLKVALVADDMIG
jgi:hypothetical protein